MLSYEQLEALEAVIKERSFQKAAATLFISQSAVSQRIHQLELTVGQPVLVRSPVINPTTAGQQLLAHQRQVKLLESSLKEKLPFQKVGVGFQSIAIALNTESLSTWFIEAIKFAAVQERIILELFTDDQDRTIDYLRTGKVWGCVTSVSRAPHGCISTYLGEMIYKCVATPQFVKKFLLKGINGKTLLNAPAAIYGEYDEMHSNYLKNIFKTYKSGRAIQHYVPSPQGLVEFVLGGMAYALLPGLSVNTFLRQGKLVDLMPEKPLRLKLYWQTQELQTEVTTRLSEAIVSYALALFEKSV